jgi:hypothetical protein
MAAIVPVNPAQLAKNAHLAAVNWQAGQGGKGCESKDQSRSALLGSVAVTTLTTLSSSVTVAASSIQQPPNQ